MEPLAASEDPELLEVRRLEQHRLGLGGDLGLLAAHDPGHGDRPLGVRDHELLGRQLPLGTVQRADPLAVARAADDDASPGEPGLVERVQGAPQRQHHVVRHVDHVRDRPHARAEQPCLEPRRRLADRHGAEQPADVARAALQILDADVDPLGARLLRVPTRQRL